MKQNENGRTLLEMLGVLAIIGVITVGAMSGLKFGTDSLRATALHEMVESTASGVADLYSWSREYPTEDNVCEPGENRRCVISLAESVPGNGICNAFQCTANGENVEANTTYGKMVISSGDTNYFVIKLTAVPKDICVRLEGVTWQTATWDEGNSCDAETQDIVFNVY